MEDRTPLQDVIPLSMPFIIFLDPSNVCNFKCTFCPTGHPEIISKTKRQTIMSFDTFTAAIDGLDSFPGNSKLKTLRLYKDGEPFVNPRLADMVRYARKSNRITSIDTTTNAALMTPNRLAELLEAGINKINISINGMNDITYSNFCRTKITFEKILDNVKWLFKNKGDCIVFIKAPSQLLTPSEQRDFLSIFGEYCDEIALENFAPCWPNFDVTEMTGIQLGSEGIYKQPLSNVDVCPYIFYSLAINSDGSVSACFIDWEHKLLVGNIHSPNTTLHDIWNSHALNSMRRMHLLGLRRSAIVTHPSQKVCGNCGHMDYCMPDNIDAYRNTLLERLKESFDAIPN